MCTWFKWLCRGSLWREHGVFVFVCVFREIVIRRWMMILQVVLSPAHAHEHTNTQWRKKNPSAKENE